MIYNMDISESVVVCTHLVVTSELQKFLKPHVIVRAVVVE